MLKEILVKDFNKFMDRPVSSLLGLQSSILGYCRFPMRQLEVKRAALISAVPLCTLLCSWIHTVCCGPFLRDVLIYKRVVPL